MELRALSSFHFRNLEGRRQEFSPGVNLVVGRNGQGKTNLLEAIAALGNLRSFRNASARKMVRHGESAYRLDGVVGSRDEDLTLRQVVELGPPLQRRLEINGSKASLETYLSTFPVFTLSSTDTALVVGPPERRRALLDRLAFFNDHGYLKELREYRRCLSQRNAALVTNRAESEQELWEERLARAAAVVFSRRMRAFEEWVDSFRKCFEALKYDGFGSVEARYRGETDVGNTEDELLLAEYYRQRYHGSRVRDRHAGYTLEGPHRHDLSLRVDGRPVRDVLSAGQIKVVAGALCLSTLMQVEERRSERLPVLIDDADAEVDAGVLTRLVSLLGDDRQAILSSAHEDNIRRVVGRGRVYRIENGTVTED